MPYNEKWSPYIDSLKRDWNPLKSADLKSFLIHRKLAVLLYSCPYFWNAVSAPIEMIHSFEERFELWIWVVHQHVIVVNFSHTTVIIVICLKCEQAHSSGFEMLEQSTMLWKDGTRITPKIVSTFFMSGVSQRSFDR